MTIAPIYPSEKTQERLNKCRKIILLGHNNDVYKIIFYTDSYASCRIELKQPLAGNDFGPASQKEFEDMKAMSLARVVTPKEAVQILHRMPFQAHSPVNEQTYTFVLASLR